MKSTQEKALIPSHMEITTRGVRFRLSCWSNISSQEHLFEIRITPQERSVMSSLNDSCWSNISMQEHLFEIWTTPQVKLIMSSLNDSTCKLNYIELQINLAWRITNKLSLTKEKHKCLFYYIFQVYSQIQHIGLYIASKWNY